MAGTRLLVNSASALFRVAILSLPAVYTLAASSKQLVNFAPVTLTMRTWYGVVLITGFVVHMLFMRVERTVPHLAGVAALTVVGHTGVYVLAVWYLRGAWVARMTVYSMLWQLLVLPAVAALLLGTGMVVAMLVLRVVHLAGGR